MDKKQLESDHRVTIAIIEEINAVLNGESEIKYRFKYDGKEFTWSVPSERWREFNIGQRVYVIFYPKNPENNDLVYDTIVPDSIKHIPENGWPEFLKDREKI
ncbi:MAG TPA: hypothetical protein PLD84_05130 [Chitinophagales bacterium]|nr:hypothetical protein [Chitinophagales bacterium]